MSVGKEVEVEDIAFGTDGDPFFPVGVVRHEDMALALIDDGPAVAGDDAGLHRVVVVDVVRSGALVEGTRGSHQVAFVFLSIMPVDGLAAHLERSGEVVRRELAALVGQGDGIGADDDAVAGPVGREFRDGRETAVDDGKGRMVFEGSVFGPFHADQARGKDGKAGIPDDDLGLCGCDGVILGPSRKGGRQQGGEEQYFLHVTSCIRRRGSSSEELRSRWKW